MIIGTLQTVFMVFFAIFWGAVANVQPRYRAFQWPLALLREPNGDRAFPQAWERLKLSVGLLNVCPILYFGLVWGILECFDPLGTPTFVGKAVLMMLCGVLPAFGVFGIYRVWIGFIELNPYKYYAKNLADIPDGYRHVDWVCRTHITDRSNPDKTGDPHTPQVLDMAPDAAPVNIGVGFGYIIVPLLVLIVTLTIAQYCLKHS